MSGVEARAPGATDVTRADGARGLIECMRDVLLANGQDARLLGTARGTIVTVPAVARLDAGVTWQAVWDVRTGFVAPEGTQFFHSTDDAGTALAAYAARVAGGGELLSPVMEELRTRPAETTATWGQKRRLSQVGSGWGHQAACGACRTGQIPCLTCSVTGEVKCPSCDYRGETSCPACRGTGDAGHHDRGRWVARYCVRCRGRGRVRCGTCTYSNHPGFLTCSRCHGGKTVDCTRCDATGGITHLASLTFELDAAAAVALSPDCPPEARGITEVLMGMLAAAPGADLRLVHLQCVQGRMSALLGFDVTLEEAEIDVEGEGAPARAMAASSLGFIVHSGFLARRLLCEMRVNVATAQAAEDALREARATRVGSSLLRLVTGKGPARGTGEEREKAAVTGALHKADSLFVDAGDLVAWWEALRDAYAVVPAEVIRRRWRMVLPPLLVFSLLTPLAPVSRLAFGGAGGNGAALASGCLLSLLAVLAARSWVGAAAKRRLRRVVPEATAAPPQGRWPACACIGAVCLSLASGIALHGWPSLRPSAGVPAAPTQPSPVVRPATPATGSADVTVLPVSFPGSAVYPLVVPPQVRGEPVLFRTQVVLAHLGLLVQSAVDGLDNPSTREALARLERLAGGQEGALRQLRRLHPAMPTTPVGRSFLLAKAALLGELEFTDPGAGTPARHLPPVVRLRQSAADVAQFQGAVEAAVSRAARPGEAQGAAWSGSMPALTAWVAIETTAELARRDAAGCFGIRLIVRGSGTAMPPRAVTVCPGDMRRPR